MIRDIQQVAITRMEKSVEALQKALIKIRTGRANPGFLDQVKVPYHGTYMVLPKIANIVVEDFRTLKITPWEIDLVQTIEKAIINSDLGVSSTIQGVVIRISFPVLTTESRQKLIKIVKNEAEHSRISIRNIRRDANDEIKKALKEKLISKDESRLGEEKIQQTTDKFIQNIDKCLELKEADLLKI